MSKKGRRGLFLITGSLVVGVGATVVFFIFADSSPAGHPDTGAVACGACHGRVAPVEAGALPGQAEGQPTGAAGELTQTKWMLVSFGEPGAETPVTGDAAITLVFYADGEAGGSGGCNAYAARYTLQDEIVAFDAFTSTVKTCPSESAAQQERRYFEALAAADRFVRAGDWLIAEYDDGQGRLTWARWPDPKP
ncbi:MAG: META domain-containing protein [Anaerolineae bacterium]|nr:META domain-containing protein [Anaerolineae bacterium]